MNQDRLERQLALDEGKRLAAYPDSEGILTVGIGHNCVAKPVAGVEKVGDRITEEQCSDLFAADIAEVYEDLDRYLPWWRELDDVRQEVLANMCFNMGIGRPGIDGLRSFVNTLAHIQAGRWDAAAAGMLSSQWARQVGARSVRLAYAMRTGAFK